MISQQAQLTTVVVLTLTAFISGCASSSSGTTGMADGPPASDSVVKPDAANQIVVANGLESGAIPELPAAQPVVPPASQPTNPAYNQDDVLWIQQRLQELGYYSGEVDGRVGMGTKDAVRAYQRDQDIDADGQPTTALREYMWRNGG